MSKFEFYSVPRIVAGRGEFNRIGELAASLGRRPLVIHNVSDSSLIQRATELQSAGGDAPVLHRQHGEPQVSDVEAAVAVARQNESSIIIGLGGGSAIDLAKAVAARLTNGGHPLDYMEVVGVGPRIVRSAAPWIAVRP